MPWHLRGIGRSAGLTNESEREGSCDREGTGGVGRSENELITAQQPLGGTISKWQIWLHTITPAHLQQVVG